MKVAMPLPKCDWTRGALPGLDDADVERGAAARPGDGHVVRA